MTIGKKLLLATGASVALTMALGIGSIWSASAAKQRFEVAVFKTSRKMEIGGRIDAIKAEMFLSQRGSVLAAFVKDTTRMMSLRQEFDRHAQEMSATLDEVRPLISVPEGRRQFGIIEESFHAWRSDFPEIARRCDAGHPEAAQQYGFDTIVPIYNQVGEAAHRFTEVYRNVLAQDKSATDSEYSVTSWVCFALTCLSVLCALVVIAVIRGVTKSLKDAVRELDEGAGQVASAASEVSSSSQSLAQGSSQQAALLEETSAATQEINTMAQKNTADCHGAASLVAEAEIEFTRTNAALGTTVDAMSEINTSSEKISKIIKVIDEIAFQTNILALNAAVEAARAGDAGMGFAVVADEVRNLAQRSAQAARDTASLIEESIAKSRDGKQKVDQVVIAIHDISENAAKVKTLVSAVDASSQEQSRGIEQIAKSVSQLDQLTQATAASSEESASAAEQLTAQSQAVKAIVARLTAMVGQP